MFAGESPLALWQRGEYRRVLETLGDSYRMTERAARTAAGNLEHEVLIKERFEELAGLYGRLAGH